MDKDDSFSNIERIMKTSKEVNELLEQDNIVDAVQREKIGVLQYLAKHITDVTDALFSNQKKITRKMKDNAFKLLTSKLSFMDSNVLKTVVCKLISFLKLNKSQKKDDETTNATSGVLHYLIKNTNCGVLSKFDQCQCLLPLLVGEMKNASISNLLDYLTHSRARHMSSFLSSVDATGFFINIVIERKEVREKFLNYVINIISSYPDDEDHFRVFTDPIKLEKILEIAFEGDIKVSELIFDLLEMVLDSIVYLDSEERQESKLYKSVVPTIMHALPKMCDYISRDGIFLMDRVSCIRTIVMFAASGIDIDNHLIDVEKYLFKMMKKYPSHSILHQQFLCVLRRFKKPEKTDKLYQLLEDLNMKDKILDAYEERTINRMFYFEFAAFVLQCDSTRKLSCSDDKKWDDFINNEYALTNEIINKPYGGEIDMDSDDDSLFEDDEEEEDQYEIDHGARIYAEEIFGKKFLMDQDDEFFDEFDAEDDVNIEEEEEEDFFIESNSLIEREPCYSDECF